MEGGGERHPVRMLAKANFSNTGKRHRDRKTLPFPFTFAAFPWNKSQSQHIGQKEIP